MRRCSILPEGTVFHECVLIFKGMPSHGPVAKSKRIERRGDWLAAAEKVVSGCDLVFADPDNGIAGKHRKHHKRGPKHAFLDELAQLVRGGQSLVVYQHVHHKAGQNAVQQMRMAMGRLTDAIDPAAEPFALLYHRGSARAFFVVPSAKHEELLSDRATKFIAGPWREHFERIVPA